MNSTTKLVEDCCNALKENCFQWNKSMDDLLVHNAPQEFKAICRSTSRRQLFEHLWTTTRRVLQGCKMFEANSDEFMREMTEANYHLFFWLEWLRERNEFEKERQKMRKQKKQLREKQPNREEQPKKRKAPMAFDFSTQLNSAVTRKKRTKHSDVSLKRLQVSFPEFWKPKNYCRERKAPERTIYTSDGSMDSRIITLK